VLAVALAIGTTATACGPIQTTQVIVAADAELAAALRANADQRAVYEYELASTYLNAARQANARSRYQVAVGYGEQALACARAALRIAQDEAAPGGAEPCGPPYSVDPPPTQTSTTTTSTTARGES
jgi:nitroreductase